MSMRFSPGLVVLCSFLLLALGCSKEPVDAVKVSQGGVGVTKHSGADCIKEGLTIECGMLSFATQQDFTDLYDCLEAEYEAHLDDFETSWGYLSEDAYNDTADYFGFVDEQPLIDFEQALSFASAREALAYAEEQFLLGGGHPSNSPVLTSPYDDNIMATLLNVNGAVMIDGVIHVIDAEGNQWTFCSCNLYEQWLQDPNSIDPEDDCSLILKGGTVTYPTCKSDWWQYCWDEYVSGSKEVNWKLKVRYSQIGDFSDAQAFIWHYKKKNGNWKPRRADVLARSYGKVNDATECVILGPYDQSKAKKRKYLRTRVVQAMQIASYLDNEAKGYWEYPNSNYVGMQLDYSIPDAGENCP